MPRLARASRRRAQRSLSNYVSAETTLSNQERGEVSVGELPLALDLRYVVVVDAVLVDVDLGTGLPIRALAYELPEEHLMDRRRRFCPIGAQQVDHRAMRRLYQHVEAGASFDLEVDKGTRAVEAQLK